MASFKWFTVCLILSIVANTFAMSFAYAKTRRHEVSSSCPADCRCNPNHDKSMIHVQCSSSKHLDEFLDTKNTQITALDLSNTSIDILDKRLKQLPNLEVLNLTSNKLIDLRNFPALPKLTHLYLRDNKLKSFSAKWLPSGLKHLDISRNRIRELPQDLLRLGLLNDLVVADNPFSCTRKSLDLRDSLLERNIQLIGHVYCHDPEKFKGKSWIHAVDFDEYFKIHDQDDFQGDEGSGVGEDRTEVATDLIEVTTDSDFLFDGSGDSIELPFVTETHHAVQNAPEWSTTTTEVPNIEPTLSADLERNLGIKIFLVVFLICLISLLIYSIKKNKEKKRAARRNKLLNEQNQELIAKPLEKLPYSAPVVNGQNGNKKQPDLEETSLLRTKPDENGDKVIEMKPLYSNVKSVTVRKSELPDSVPHTPILITRSKSSDGKHIVVTPNLNRIP